MIPFEIAGVKSGNVTRGHRQSGRGVDSGDHRQLRERAAARTVVILAAHERRHKIEKEAAALGAKLDGDLVETLTYITEFPTAIRGDFDPAYLELPAEVLTTVMRHHQKYFSVEDAPGKLAPNFVAVMNTSGDPEGLVKHGNERVLKARFNDARFFWNVDQQKKLADRVDDLAKVTFQAKLGSYKEKTDRVVALVKELGGDANAQRAALLCKVRPDHRDGEGVHRSARRRRRTVRQGAGRARGSLARDLRALQAAQHGGFDSRDTRGANRRAGRQARHAARVFRRRPDAEGSKDPFALRRAAQGVVKILVEAGLDYKLDSLAQGELHAFLLERVQHYFREVRGFKYDEVNAVLKVGVSTLKDVEDRLEPRCQGPANAEFRAACGEFQTHQQYSQAGQFHARRGSSGDAGGWSGTGTVRSLRRGCLRHGPLEDVAELRPRVDRFFDKVMVNAPDPKIRENRLSMLSDMLRKFSTIADFSEIVTSGDQKS